MPVYAVDKAGAPVLNLSPDDIEIYIKNIRVEKFDIHKKQFQVSETKKGVAPASKPQPPPQKKLVFLVFDGVYTDYTAMANARRLAEIVIDQSDKSADYVLLSIEPYAGLHYILGPTRNVKLLEQKENKYLEGKKHEFAFGGGAYFDLPPLGGPGNTFSPLVGGMREVHSLGDPSGGLMNMIDYHEWLNKKRFAAGYASSLMTLDTVLTLFRDYSKVIYLCSSGIPADALLDRTEFSQFVPGVSDSANPKVDWIVYFSFDSLAYDTLKTIGTHFNRNGALLFIINPLGDKVFETDRNSGEASLRILANESGGRYFEGPGEAVAAEVNNMERGYYEISFPDKPEYEGQDLSFKIRSKKTDLQIFTVKTVGREKSYADMTELEKEATVMNILNEGPFSQAGRKVSFVSGDSIRDGDSLVCLLRLPDEIARSEWTAYKIARDLATGRIFMDKEVLFPTEPSVRLKMKWRGKGFRHDLVLAHTRTGNIIVWK